MLAIGYIQHIQYIDYIHYNPIYLLVIIHYYWGLHLQPVPEPVQRQGHWACDLRALWEAATN